MLTQLLIGSLLICLTIVVEAICLGTALIGIQRLRPWLRSGPGIPKLIASIALITLWMLGGLSVSVWSWAGAMMLLELFVTLEEAVYFSIVSFTTLGFGDDILPQPWRLLSGLIATNGLVLFGLTTAFLFEALDRLRLAQEGN
ncbi:MAG: ion channel [Burkholderiaceae bacterium]